VTHILRPGKALEKTPKGVIPPSLCEISQNASRKNNLTMRSLRLRKVHSRISSGRENTPTICKKRDP
jgi:hypothetical protein